MESGDLIRQRRNRVEANSYNGKKAIMPANKHTQRSWDQQMNINILDFYFCFHRKKKI